MRSRCAIAVLILGASCAETREAPRRDGGAPIPDAALADAARPDATAGHGGNEAGVWDSGVDASTGGTCEPPELNREPGPPVYDLSAKGKGTCADSALGTVIDAVHALHPELDDIVELYVPDPNRGGDQSYIYAFETTLDGGFALVFRRGAGDGPAGCTENDYY